MWSRSSSPTSAYSSPLGPTSLPAEAFHEIDVPDLAPPRPDETPPGGEPAIESSRGSLYFPYQLISYSGKCTRAMTTAMDEDRLSETFAALANSTRRAILARLAEG